MPPPVLADGRTTQIRFIPNRQASEGRCWSSDSVRSAVNTSASPSRRPRRALRKLRLLDAAEDVSDLRIPPGNRLERLHGGRAGPHSIRINDQWRICFRWDAGNAYDIEIVDYH